MLSGGFDKTRLIQDAQTAYCVNDTRIKRDVTRHKCKTQVAGAFDKCNAVADANKDACGGLVKATIKDVYEQLPRGLYRPGKYAQLNTRVSTIVSALPAAPTTPAGFNKASAIAELQTHFCPDGNAACKTKIESLYNLRTNSDTQAYAKGFKDRLDAWRTDFSARNPGATQQNFTDQLIEATEHNRANYTANGIPLNEALQQLGSPVAAGATGGGSPPPAGSNTSVVIRGSLIFSPPAGFCTQSQTIDGYVAGCDNMMGNWLNVDPAAYLSAGHPVADNFEIGGHLLLARGEPKGESVIPGTTTTGAHIMLGAYVSKAWSLSSDNSLKIRLQGSLDLHLTSDPVLTGVDLGSIYGWAPGASLGVGLEYYVTPQFGLFVQGNLMWAGRPVSLLPSDAIVNDQKVLGAQTSWLTLSTGNVPLAFPFYTGVIKRF